MRYHTVVKKVEGVVPGLWIAAHHCFPLCLTLSIKGAISRAMNKLDREARARILHLLCAA